MNTRRTWGTLLAAGMAMLVTFACLQATRAASPPNPPTDIPWSAGTGGVADVERAFNAARRREEQLLGLSPGTLGMLTLPRQRKWDRWSDEQKALHLINGERMARGGSGTDVLGLRLSDVQTDVQELAQAYAEQLVAHNAFSHELNGRDPFQRIAEHPLLGPCSEFLGRAENLALFGTTGSSIPLYVEQAVYNWLYVDAHSAWGHRETLLLQDRDLTYEDPRYGFKNNVTSAAHEGFIGLGVVHSSDGRYDPFNWGIDTTVLLVLEVIDPLPEEGCPWEKEPAPTATPRPTAAPPPWRVRDRVFLPLARG